MVEKIWDWIRFESIQCFCKLSKHLRWSFWCRLSDRILNYKFSHCFLCVKLMIRSSTDAAKTLQPKIVEETAWGKIFGNRSDFLRSRGMGSCRLVERKIQTLNALFSKPLKEFPHFLFYSFEFVTISLKYNLFVLFPANHTKINVSRIPYHILL